MGKISDRLGPVGDRLAELSDRVKAILDEDAERDERVTKVLAGAIVLSLLLVVGFALVPVGGGDPYTEFYVLGPDGTASGYPQNVTVGETAELRIGVGNFENRQLTYTFVVRTDETTFATRTVTLDPREKWEAPTTVTFDSPGNKRLRLELYVGEATDGEPYRSLRLFVDVTP
jgi:uncharacterized membrane protein